MKQFERGSAALPSDAAVVLRECSCDERYRHPVLTIMTPFRAGDSERTAEPPMSVRLDGDSDVRALYDLLHQYYSQNKEA